MSLPLPFYTPTREFPAPLIYPYSPTLLPEPQDFPPRVHVAGYHRRWFAPLWQTSPSGAS
ncbi:MAG: hypothetical protein VB089_21100 [Anaerolineaceae bacterium]|nr:hypothetical protein [Anaerolineaceae bacterium]